MHWLDSDHLPHVTSNVCSFLLNPRGEVDGMILANGLEVHTPPHLSDEICANIRRGDHVTVHGVRPRSADMMVAVAIVTEQGQRIVDNGPPKDHRKRHAKGGARDGATGTPPRKLKATGPVHRALHGPKGEIRGCLLEDGTIVRIPAHEVDSLGTLLSPGALLVVHGEGRVCELGTVIEAWQLGASVDDLHPLKHKKPKDGKQKKHRHPSESLPV